MLVVGGVDPIVSGSQFDQQVRPGVANVEHGFAFGVGNHDMDPGDVRARFFGKQQAQAKVTARILDPVQFFLTDATRDVQRPALILPG